MFVILRITNSKLVSVCYEIKLTENALVQFKDMILIMFNSKINS